MFGADYTSNNKRSVVYNFYRFTFSLRILNNSYLSEYLQGECNAFKISIVTSFTSIDHLVKKKIILNVLIKCLVKFGRAFIWQCIPYSHDKVTIHRKIVRAIVT